MVERNNQIASAYRDPLGDVVGYKKDNVQYQEKLRAYDFGLDKVADALHRKYEVDAEEERTEARKQEASDKLTGSLLGLSEGELPEDASEATVRAHRASKHMLNVTAAVNKIIPTFDSEEFQKLTRDNQDKQLHEIKRNLMDTLATADVQDNDGSKKFVIAQLKSINVAVANSRNNYKNMVLPRKTMGNIVDMLITSGADEETWKQQLTVMQDKGIVGRMPATEITKVVYGEAIRAIESGSIEVYNAVKNDPIYESMTSNQKLQLDRSHEREVVQERTATINNVTKSFRSTIEQITATGDVSLLEDVYKQLEAFPADISEAVIEKIAPSLEKIQPTVGAINRLVLRMAGNKEAILDDKQSEIAFDYATREVMNEGGGDIGVQQSQQIASMQLASIGIYNDNTQDAYDMQNPSFVDGIMDSRTENAMLGGDKLYASNISSRDMERIMGNKNYDIYAQAKEHREKGLDPHLAMSMAINNNTAYENSDAFSKAQKKLADLDEVNQSGYIESFVDTVSDVFGIVLSDPRDILASPFELQQSTELELYTKAPIGEAAVELGDALTGGVADSLGQANSNKATLGYLEYQRKYPAQNATTQLNGYKRYLEEDGIISNGSLVINERLGDRLKAISGGTTMRNANKYLSLTMQALTPLIVLPRADQLAIQDTVTDVYRQDAQGNYTLITDNTERKRIVEEQRYKKDDSIRVSINRQKYDDLYSEGGTLSDGRTISAIRSAITDLGGVYDTRALGREFVQHRLDYDENTRTFLVTGLDQSGDILTTDKPILDIRTVDGKEVITTELEADSPIRGAIPEDLVAAFMQSYTTQED